MRLAFKTNKPENPFQIYDLAKQRTNMPKKKLPNKELFLIKPSPQTNKQLDWIGSSFVDLPKKLQDQKTGTPLIEP